MPLTAEEYQEMATLSAELGDEQGELEALEGLEGTGAFETTKPDFPGAGIIEPARAVASGVGRTVQGGLRGIFDAADPRAEPGAGAQSVKDVQAEAFQPETRAGQEGFETLNTLIQKGADIVNIPLSGIGGILELVSGQGIDQAVETINAIQGQGVSKTAGERTFEETGSPLAATIAETAPAAIESIVGIKGAALAPRALERAGEATGTALSVATEAGTPAFNAIERVAKELSDTQSPTKRRIAELLVKGSDDVDTAGFRLKEPTTPRPESPTKLQQFLDVGGPKIEKIPAAQNAIKQGFGKGVIAAVQGASPADKSAMLEMVKIGERIKNNAKFGMRNRPSDVTGDLLMSRLRVVQKANSDAGKQIDSVAKSLKGKPVDVKDIGASFSSALDDMGITLSRNAEGKITPSFKGSDIEGLSGPENVVTRAINRIDSVAGSGNIDALKLHQLKRFIDEQVTFGKNAEGLAGKTETALKDLRFNIKETLNSNFPEYADVNTTYSETIGVLDRFQDIAGRKMNLTGDNAEKATGTLMRRLMGNAQSRIRLLDSIDEIEGAANKFGGKGQLLIEGPGGSKNDLLTQVLFASELDEVFGPAARTSLQGEFDSVIRRAERAATSRGGAVDIAIDVAEEGFKRFEGINEAGAFKAIKELLKEVEK